jgi:hypothetical protein
MIPSYVDGGLTTVSSESIDLGSATCRMPRTLISQEPV